MDDATEHKPIRVENAPAEADEQHIAGCFDPVCTAHSGVQYFSCGNKDVQRKVYISFHFVPGDAYPGQGTYDYCVRPNGALTQQLVDLSLQELATAGKPGLARTRALIKLGIALHTYADTWAHQRFSGRHSASDNDIQDRERFEGGTWNALGFFERAALDLLPDVGHAEAGTMPDASDLRWRYKHDKTGAIHDRDNPSEFLDAANAIFARLSACTQTNASLPQGIDTCLRNGGPSLRVWSQEFPDVFKGQPDYDPHAWRKAALAGGHVDWDRFTTAEQFGALSYSFNGDPKWFLFHAEAGKQRDFVLRRIRYDLG